MADKVDGREEVDGKMQMVEKVDDRLDGRWWGGGRWQMVGRRQMVVSGQLVGGRWQRVGSWQVVDWQMVGGGRWQRVGRSLEVFSLRLCHDGGQLAAVNLHICSVM